MSCNVATIGVGARSAPGRTPIVACLRDRGPRSTNQCLGNPLPDTSGRRVLYRYEDHYGGTRGRASTKKEWSCRSGVANHWGLDGEAELLSAHRPSERFATPEGKAARRRAVNHGELRLNRTTLDSIRDGAGEGDRRRLLFSAAANLGEFGCSFARAFALLSPAARDSGLSPKEAHRQRRSRPMPHLRDAAEQGRSASANGTSRDDAQPDRLDDERLHRSAMARRAAYSLSTVRRMNERRERCGPRTACSHERLHQLRTNWCKRSQMLSKWQEPSIANGKWHSP